MHDTNRTRSLASSVDRSGTTFNARNHHDEVTPPPRFLYASPKMAEIEQLIRKYAAREGNVFITGDSGVGKDLIARWLHFLSPRSRQELIALNCALIPSELIVGELLGVDRGAYTGALPRPGLLELAHRSSLFLDEIGEMPPVDQPKLLRVLEDRIVRPLGGSKLFKADVRIISATNIDLTAAIQERRFRQDLYERLSVFLIHVPPLRERPEDIEVLLKHFLQERAFDGLLSNLLAPSALALLKKYPWPGNVRELKNLTERLIVHHEPGQAFEGADVEPLLNTRPLSAEPQAVPPSQATPSISLPKRGKPGPKPKWLDLDKIRQWLAQKKPIAWICRELDISRSRFYSRPEIRDILGLAGYCI
jgi:transcriptional regulator with PAS, ATPase and Fis domain